MKKTPKSIAIIGIITFIVSIIMISLFSYILYSLMVIPNPYSGEIQGNSTTLLYGLLEIIICISGIIVSIGFLKGKKWAWYFMFISWIIIFLVLCSFIMAALWFYFLLPLVIPSIVATIVILTYIFKNRDYFDI
jgi:hypothetical protein